MRGLLSTFTAALLAAQSALAFPYGGEGTVTPTNETVTVNLASTGSAIPANFVCLSAENQDMIAGGIYTGTDTSFIGLAKLLGSNGILRMGGTSADQSGSLNLNQTIANNLWSFTSALGAGWSLIFNLDFGVNNTTDALTQAGYVINAAGLNNVIFQMGNEFDGDSFYQSRWNTYYSALTGAYPTMRFAAPDDNGAGAVQASVTGLTPGVSGLTYISFHYYSYLNPNDGTFVNPNPAQYASAVAGTNFGLNASFSQGKMGITEFGGIEGGGSLGATDRLMQTAYYLNTAIDSFNAGVNFICYHAVLTPWAGWGSRLAYYNAFKVQLDGGYSPTPVFYGMALFSKIEGQVTAAITKSGTGNVNAIATVGSNGNANILVVNNDPAAPVQVTPAQSKPWSLGQVLAIAPGSAANCTDTAPMIGGAAIGEGGAWNGGAYPIANGAVVTIQPCSAALIQIQQ